MACYFIRIPCASSGTKRRTHRTEERQQTRPNALCRQRYYRIWRPVLPDAARPTTATTSTPTSSPSGPMTRARAKLLQAKVNSLLSLCDFDTPLDGLLLHTHTLCIIRYEEKNPQDEGAPADKTKCSLSPAVLPDLATGTTAWRYYRQMLLPTTEGSRAAQELSVTGGTTGPDPVLPAGGTTGPCYRHQQKTPAQVPG